MMDTQTQKLIDYCLLKKNNEELSATDLELLAELKGEKTSKVKIYIGAGTCGLGAGAAKIKLAASKYVAYNQIDAQFIDTGCIGLCAYEPIVDIHLPGFSRISFAKVTEENIQTIFDEVFVNKAPRTNVLGQFPSEERQWKNVNNIYDFPFLKPQKRIVLQNCGKINPVKIEEYIANGGYTSYLKAIREYTPAEVCDIVEKSGLRGRGGAGFPTGKKWKFAQTQEANQKYMICNADEGDPGAFMDRAVIEGDPHRLVEGMAIAAYAVGATKAYVYIRAEYPLAIEHLKVAIDQATKHGIIGKNIFDSGVDFEIKIKTGAGAFVCGEETALLNSIEGKRGMPRPRPPFPAIKGLFGKPTIINNVETLANVPDIIRNGSQWFASIGTENSKGTKVFALSGKIRHTGLVEVPMGTTIKDVIFSIGGGIKENKKFKAVQIGGPSGGCITEQNLEIPIDYDSLVKVGAMMGSGGLVVMDEDNCMVDVAKFFMDFIQRESCGKCTPCREGTKRMLEILESITTKPRTPEDSIERFNGILQLERIANTVKSTSLCGLGQTAPNPVLSTLRWFKEEYEQHVFAKRCPANVCSELKRFIIDNDKCTGCHACVRKCPTNAIHGTPKGTHYILEHDCIGCGTCFSVCKFDAIYIKT
ncbi:MAG: NADH-quinone oxidoreductase subunit NuoF [Candidatus Kapaibacterium sp.]|jgi:NADH:ubiquinone oxidoreductase subunit F (NADH-binding)/Pyruvate/2-oxoacid:ferredoxin oxidoreductase delta subunit/(2Fe-2S) ferredoxin